jgi:hypothetical protein
VNNRGHADWRRRFTRLTTQVRQFCLLLLNNLQACWRDPCELPPEKAFPARPTASHCRRTENHLSLRYSLPALKRAFVHGHRLCFVAHEDSRLQAHSDLLATREDEAEPRVFSRRYGVVVRCQSAIEFCDFSSGRPSPEFDTQRLQRGYDINVDSGRHREGRLRQRRSKTYERRRYQSYWNRGIVIWSRAVRLCVQTRSHEEQQ